MRSCGVSSEGIYCEIKSEQRKETLVDGGKYRYHKHSVLLLHFFLLCHLKDTFDGEVIQLHSAQLYFWNSCGSQQQTNMGKDVSRNVHLIFGYLGRVCSDLRTEGISHPPHPACPGFLALPEVSPALKTTSFPAPPPRVLSYLFHLTPQPINATPLGFGDSRVSHLMDGDGRAGGGGMDGSHCGGKRTYGS